MTLATKKLIVACIWVVMGVTNTLALGVNWFSWVTVCFAAWIMRHQLMFSIDPDAEEHDKNIKNNSEDLS